MRFPVLSLFALLSGTIFSFVNAFSAEEAAPTKEKKVHFMYRSFNTEPEALRTFHEMGIDTVCFFAANTINSLGEPYCQYPPFWLGFGRYDFKYLDAQIADIVAANPKAKLICMVDLNTPPWATRRFHFDSFSEISTAAAHAGWRQETAKYLEAFLKYAEEKHKDRIAGYILSAGMTSEWFESNRGRGSRVKNNAWRDWNKHNGSPTEEDPPSPRTLESASFEGALYDPAKEPLSSHYWKFHNDVIADALIEMARKTRTIIPAEKEIGVFFGYIFVGGSPVHFGHLAYERVYAAPEIDFYISPGSYGDRQMGGGSGAQLMLGTLRFHGKRYMHEADHRTSTARLSPSQAGTALVSKSQAEDSATLKREAAFALINHASIWWFDMWGGYYQTEETLNLLKKLKGLWERWGYDRSESLAEVLIVADPQSAVHVNDRHAIAAQMYYVMWNKLNRLGAPFDAYSFNDLSKIDMSRYKLVLLPGTFEITPEKGDVLKKHVFNNNRTVLWIYAPGIIDGKSLDPARVEHWTGTPYRTPGISKVAKDGWTSVYSHTYGLVTPEVLKELAREAGATIFCEEKVPVYANEKLFALHCADGGRKKITLPFPCKQIVDVLTDKVVAENCKDFEYEFQSPDTVLFEMRR